MKLHESTSKIRAGGRGRNRNLRRVAGLLAGGLIATALLAGCQTTNEPAAPGDEELPQLSFGVLRAPTGALAVVADDHGWYADAGVEMEFKSFAEGGGPAIIQAMAGGEPDIALLNLATTVLALGQGTFDVQIVAVASNPSEALPLLSIPEIKTVEDLRGRKVSTPPSGGLYYVLAATLQKFGMTFDDIDFKPLPVGEAQAAFLTGKIDAVVSSANGAQLIQNAKPDTHVLFDGTDFEPADHFGMPDVIIATQDAVKNKPEAIASFLKAYHGKAIGEFLNNPDSQSQAVEEIQAYMESVGAGVELELTAAVVDAIEWYDFDDAKEILQSDEFLATTKAQAQFWLDSGVIEEMPDVEGAINTTLIDG